MSIIEINNLTKEFKRGQLKSLRHTALNAFDRLRGKTVEKPKPFKALDDVSFKVEPGEVLGIIGQNGAGKSTILKMLAGISTPTRGEVKVRGSVAPLIEVGAGLIGDLTGRENIFLNGSVLGLSRAEIKRKFDEIVAFAELEEFIETPIKRYSSGMAVRLGFAIAASVDADILIMDEVLAVGDLAFQRKCFDRMEDMIKRQGKTVLLVSHNIRQVERMCSRAILLDRGRIMLDGDKSRVCEQFYRCSNSKIAIQVAESNVEGRHVRKTGEVELEVIELLDKDGKKATEFFMGDAMTIRSVFSARRSVESPEVHVGFHTTDFFYIASMGDGHIVERPDLGEGLNVVECHLPSLPLMPGTYAVRLSVLDKYPREMFYGEMLKTFTVNAHGDKTARMPALGVVHIPAEWSFGEPSMPRHTKWQKRVNDFVDFRM
jgi:lipopolysaccharide transport system ATP-binding protein